MKKIIISCLLACIFICGNALPATKKSGSNIQLSGQVFIVTKGQQTFKLALVQVFAVPEAVISKVIASRVTDRNEILRNIPSQLIEKMEAVDQARAKYRATGIPELNVGIADYFEKCRELNKGNNASCYHSTELDELNSRRSAAGKEAAPYEKQIEAAYQEHKNLAIKYVNQRNSFKFFDGIESDIKDASVIIKTDADGNFNIEAQRGKRIAIFARAKRQVIGDIEEYIWLVWVTPTNGNKIMLSNDNLIETKCAECIDFRKDIEWNNDVATSIKKLYPEFPDSGP